MHACNAEFSTPDCARGTKEGRKERRKEGLSIERAVLVYSYISSWSYPERGEASKGRDYMVSTEFFSYWDTHKRGKKPRRRARERGREPC